MLMRYNPTHIKHVMKPIGQLIHVRLQERGMSVSHLARQLSCERSNLYRIFERESIDTRLLLRISRVLEYDFFRLYSDELRKEKPVSKERQ